MKDWFLRQSPRDRIIVIVVSALTLIVLLYALVWFPLTSRVEQSRQAVSAKQETVQFIEQAGVQLNSASAASGSQRKTSDKAPYLIIDQVIREASMGLPEPSWNCMACKCQP